MMQEIAKSIADLFKGKVLSIRIDSNKNAIVHSNMYGLLMEETFGGPIYTVNAEIAIPNGTLNINEIVNRVNGVCEHGKIVCISYDITSRALSSCKVTISVGDIEKFVGEITDFEYKQFSKEFIAQLEDKLND